MKLYLVYMDDGFDMTFWADNPKHAMEQANDGYFAKAIKAVVVVEGLEI